VKWYQWDPTKWFITACNKLGLATHLRVFPEREIDKGRLTMQLRNLKAKQDKLEWPMDSNDLPVINWESCRFPRVSVATVCLRFFGQSKHSPRLAHSFSSEGLFTIYPRSWISTPEVVVCYRLISGRTPLLPSWVVSMSIPTPLIMYVPLNQSEWARNSNAVSDSSCWQ